MNHSFSGHSSFTSILILLYSNIIMDVYHLAFLLWPGDENTPIKILFGGKAKVCILIAELLIFLCTIVYLNKKPTVSTMWACSITILNIGASIGITLSLWMNNHFIQILRKEFNNDFGEQMSANEMDSQFTIYLCFVVGTCCGFLSFQLCTIYMLFNYKNENEMNMPVSIQTIAARRVVNLSQPPPYSMNTYSNLRTFPLYYVLAR